jgi:hypothetical protein
MASSDFSHSDDHLHQESSDKLNIGFYVRLSRSLNQGKNLVFFVCDSR